MRSKRCSQRYRRAPFRGCVQRRLRGSPDVKRRIVGQWDRFRLDEAFSNIISNAIKYGAGHPIDIQLQASDENAVLVVEDHGIGIAPDDLSRIFGSFERTVASKNYGGLGLGLYIARQIIEQLRGSIRAENRPCGGARFVIKVPLVSSTETILKN